MKHIKTISNRVLKDTMKHGGCGECQTSCQSACKTSCTVGNQSCENKNNDKVIVVSKRVLKKLFCDVSYLSYNVYENIYGLSEA